MRYHLLAAVEALARRAFERTKQYRTLLYTLTFLDGLSYPASHAYPVIDSDSSSVLVQMQERPSELTWGKYKPAWPKAVTPAS